MSEGDVGPNNISHRAEAISVTGGDEGEQVISLATINGRTIHPLVRALNSPTTSTIFNLGQAVEGEGRGATTGSSAAGTHTLAPETTTTVVPATVPGTSSHAISISTVRLQQDIRESNTRVGTPHAGPEVNQPEEDTEKRESQLRKRILEIHMDQSIPPAEKARRVQEIMSGKWSKKFNGHSHAGPSNPNQVSSDQLKRSADEGNSVLPVAKEEDCKPSYHIPETKVLGCSHYSRKCKLYANCCQTFYPCRLCHDATVDHTYDRKATRFMLCMLCNTVQPAGQNCIKCEEKLGHYYCDICKFWDDDDTKKIYHCDDCGICRIGKGLGIDFFHCPTCACCLSIDLQGNHRCIERSVDCDCPVCGEYMFNSTTLVRFMRCGHSIHNDCYEELKLSSYQCPICWKSLGPMEEYFQLLDSALAEHTMPEDYRNISSEILCNDCEGKSITAFHFLYHKCQLCGSYNTRLIQTMERRTIVATEDNSGGEEAANETEDTGMNE